MSRAQILAHEERIRARLSARAMPTQRAYVRAEVKPQISGSQQLANEVDLALGIFAIDGDRASGVGTAEQYISLPWRQSWLLPCIPFTCSDLDFGR